jgi:hypothetical protein
MDRRVPSAAVGVLQMKDAILPGNGEKKRTHSGKRDEMMREAIFLAAIAALTVPMPIAAQIARPRAIDGTAAKINTPMVQQSVKAKPAAPVTIRVADYPLSEATLWHASLPHILFLERGKDGANDQYWGYRLATPPWTFEQRTSRNTSISFIARRELSDKPCPSSLQILLHGEALLRNGFRFEPGSTSQSAGTFSKDGRGHGHRYIRDDRYERMEIPFNVKSINVPTGTFLKLQRCEAIIAFDVFVTGPRGADPFAAAKLKMTRDRSLTDVARTINSASALDLAREKLRNQRTIKK